MSVGARHVVVAANSTPTTTSALTGSGLVTVSERLVFARLSTSPGVCTTNQAKAARSTRLAARPSPLYQRPPCDTGSISANGGTGMPPACASKYCFSSAFTSAPPKIPFAAASWLTTSNFVRVAVRWAVVVLILGRWHRRFAKPRSPLSSPALQQHKRVRTQVLFVRRAKIVTAGITKGQTQVFFCALIVRADGTNAHIHYPGCLGK